ncbi:MAG TPA: peptide chain release factor N(5)-glutamine methyltransferase [Bdellovibrionales bacterium]|nr:peptide chain release factor N(5)-glutamine methyltransferase [Bdellovibrionales bacterium]
MTVGDILNKAIELLRARKIENPRLDAEILVSAALGWERSDLYTNSFQQLEKTELGKCIDWLERRQGGEPVAYILGKKGFYKHEFMVSPDVLIPRPESELVVEEALSWLHTDHVEQPRLVDLGAGSGCIGLSLAAEMPSAKLLAVDNSLAALEVLRENAQRIGVIHRTAIWDGDAANLDSNVVRESLGGLADVVVANPPYIGTFDPELDENVKKFEPHSALFAGPEGLEAIRTWSAAAQSYLRPGGLCVFEIGSRQGQAAKEIFKSLPHFEEVTVLKDLAGLDRVIRAKRRA